jgi:aspartyl-tRNA(Asn)/glutamyl-tRNA(Gln) amidotransferase subunit C
MNLTPTQIQHIARLARLQLTEDEVTRYATQLSGVLDYISLLDEVQTDDVEETTQVTGLMDVVREDHPEPISAEERAALLSSFPDRIGDVLKVQAVFDRSQEK